MIRSPPISENSFIFNTLFSSLFSQTVSTGKKGKRVWCVFHVSVRRQELWKTHQAFLFRDFGQESQSNWTCGESQNESLLFLLLLPIPVAGSGLQISGFLNVFPAQNCFHVCILLAKSGPLLTASFLHCVQEPFFVWKDSEFSLHGNQRPSSHWWKRPSCLLHCGACFAKVY